MTAAVASDLARDYDWMLCDYATAYVWLGSLKNLLKYPKHEPIGAWVLAFWPFLLLILGIIVINLPITESKLLAVLSSTSGGTSSGFLLVGLSVILFVVFVTVLDIIYWRAFVIYLRQNYHHLSKTGDITARPRFLHFFGSEFSAQQYRDVGDQRLMQLASRVENFHNRVAIFVRVGFLVLLLGLVALLVGITL